MRPLKILTIGVVGGLVLLGTALPAHAGGPVTVFDPVPERFEADHSYTLGYWFLQHAKRPFDGDLGTATVRLAGAGGKELVFEAVELPEPAHYAVALAVPAGSWVVYTNVEGFPSEYCVGRLDVPGTLELVDTGEVPASRGGPDTPWDTVHPPAFSGTTTDTGAAVIGDKAGKGDRTDRTGAAPDAADSAGSPQESPFALLAFGVAVVLLGAWLGLRPLLRRLRG